MSHISTEITNPVAELDDIKAIASFVAGVVDRMSFHGYHDELSKEDFRGLSQILDWMYDRIERSQNAVAERLAASDVDVLMRAGIPLEALNNELHRNAWKAGFSHGLAHAGKGALT